MDDKNEDIQKRRFLDPSKITVKLKDEEDEEDEKKDEETKKETDKKPETKELKEKKKSADPNKTPDMEAGEEEELKQIKQYEKTV